MKLYLVSKKAYRFQSNFLQTIEWLFLISCLPRSICTQYAQINNFRWKKKVITLFLGFLWQPNETLG